MFCGQRGRNHYSMLRNSRKGVGTMFIVAVVGIPLLVIFFLAVMLSGQYAPGESINILKVQEQGGTELFSLLNQEDCVEGVPFKEIVAAAILQDEYDDVPVYKPDGTMEEADLRGCVDDYMDYIRKASPASMLPACSNIGDYDVLQHIFLRRVCNQEVTYILNVRHGSCTQEDELCFARSGHKPGNSFDADRIAYLVLFGIPGHFLFAAADGVGFVIQKELIAVPGENPAIAILSFRREPLS